MEEKDNKGREEIYSRAIRAGKRTYFFDVKSTRGGDYYLTITESKRRFDNDQGKYFYEKHKLFLYKEDFEKFRDGFEDTVGFIQEKMPVQEKLPESENVDTEKNNEQVEAKTEKVETKVESETVENTSTNEEPDFTDVSFDDLGSDDK